VHGLREKLNPADFSGVCGLWLSFSVVMLLNIHHNTKHTKAAFDMRALFLLISKMKTT
jgi:hypothetical protein